MPEIRLMNASWSFDEAQPLGKPGGFGEVFRGLGPNGEVAVKRLKMTAGAAAFREMSIGESLANRGLQHVVPVLDFGLDANSDNYFLVMPICQGSLQDLLDKKGPLTIEEAKEISISILSALIEVEDIVHRDLKPGNVLLLDGQWRLADFGIAKFVEDSTSLQSLRGNLTPAYGAPEQWEGEGPTHATDVYALGCMIHAMLNGSPPFVGSQDQVRDAHLHSAAPPLGVDQRLSAFVNQMLRKTPAARPDIVRCMQVISTVATSNSVVPHKGLLAAAHEVGREAAAAEAAAHLAATHRRQYDQLIKGASDELGLIVGRLFSQIRDASGEVKSDGRSISLGRSTLAFSPVKTLLNRRSFDISANNQNLDVVAYATVQLKQLAARPRRENNSDVPRVIFVDKRSHPDFFDYTWGATLFFARSAQASSFRWREVGFWSFNARSSDRDQPYSLEAGTREFAEALGTVMSVENVAYGPFAIDGEDEVDFQGRWLSLFSRAAIGKLTRSMNMPIGASFFDDL